MSERIYDHLVRWPRVWIAACFALAGAFALFAQLEIDTRLEIWFLEDDPAVATYDRYLERFETDEFAAVAVIAEDVFDAEVLAQVDALGRAALGLAGAINVLSLATADRVDSDGETLSIRPLFDEVPTDSAELERMRALVHADRMLRDLVAADDSATVVLVEHVRFDDLADKARFARELRALANEHIRTDFVAAGNAFVDEALQAYTKRDLRVLAPLTLIAIVLITFALFRNLWCTVVPTAVIGLTLASTVGLAGLFGVKLNIITTIVLPLAIAVGVADTVHVIAGYRERLGRGLAPAEALRTAWIELLYPCLITTLTTAAGLGSLLAANLTPIRQFGWMGAATVLFALLYTLVLIPPVFSLVPAPAPKLAAAGPMGAVLRSVADFSWARHRLVIALVCALIGLSAAGAMRIEVGADFAAYFKPGDPLFQASRYIDQNLGGTGSFDLLVEADDIRAPEVLAAIDVFEQMVLDNPAVLTTESPATFVMTLHERYFGDPERYRLPGTLQATAQLLSQSEGTTAHERLMLVDYSAARVRARVRSSDYRALLDAMPTIERSTEETFGGVARAELTGVGKLVANLDTYIIRSQIRSFLLAFATVGILLGVFFRSVHFGVWALVPNALPILMVLGVMGWFGVLLDVGTVMVASIMLGLIVDDTVHYLARYRIEYARLSPEQRRDPEALRRCARDTGIGTGRAIATTSLILACGFWVSLFASFQPNINFGLMCGAATMIALVCDLVALPAVIRLVPLRR